VYCVVVREPLADLDVALRKEDRLRIDVRVGGALDLENRLRNVKVWVVRLVVEEVPGRNARRWVSTQYLANVLALILPWERQAAQRVVLNLADLLEVRHRDVVHNSAVDRSEFADVQAVVVREALRLVEDAPRIHVALLEVRRADDVALSEGDGRLHTKAVLPGLWQGNATLWGLRGTRCQCAQRALSWLRAHREVRLAILELLLCRNARNG